jgi:CxxC-x17-CxxC domain-containing protein
MFERKYGGSSSGGRSGGSNYNSGPREMTDVTCSECGKQTQVPFKPDGTRPVYCSECYQKHRPARAPRRF